MPNPAKNDGRRPAVLPRTVNEAREAYKRGNFDAVIALLGETRLGPAMPTEARLLRARAMHRSRPHDVLDELRIDDIATFATADERATAAMLRGAALARIDPCAAVAELAGAYTEAERSGAHPSLVAETAYFRAFAYWCALDLDAAGFWAEECERLARDILAVRAIQLRAFVTAARHTPTRYADALALFRIAARRYTECRERDVLLATIIIEQISALEQTLRSATVPGSHRLPRGRSLPGTAFGPVLAAPPPVRILYNDAWLFALDGDDVRAFRAVRDAEDMAPSLPWRARAVAARAQIAAVCGEFASARLHCDQAAELANRINFTKTSDDERFVLLELAEAYAQLGDHSAAAASLSRFDAIDTDLDASKVLHRKRRDPRLAGWYAYIIGLVRRGQGDRASAADAFRAAVDEFASCGYLWREAHALIDLAATDGVPDAGLHLDRAATLIRENFPDSFLARRLGPWMRAAVDPLVSSLTAAERDVLRHLLEGRTQREIAALTGRAYNTVRTQMQALHRKLGTSSEHQIVVACARRGIGAPTWSFGERSDALRIVQPARREELA